MTGASASWLGIGEGSAVPLVVDSRTEITQLPGQAQSKWILAPAWTCDLVSEAAAQKTLPVNHFFELPDPRIPEMIVDIPPLQLHVLGNKMSTFGDDGTLITKESGLILLTNLSALL